MNKEILKKTIILLAIFLFFANWSACFDPDPDEEMNLYVPYQTQDHPNWCGIACIQMWNQYCEGGLWIPQLTIAKAIDVWYERAHPRDLLRGVGMYTDSPGHLAHRSFTEPGSQGDLIAATVTGVLDYNPSIMPFWEEHAVLIKGYKYRYKEIKDEYGNVVDTIPIAIYVYYNDPGDTANIGTGIASLKNLFVPCPFDYWVIVGFQHYVPQGVDGHNSFILRGGSYYGGPLNYNPKGL